MPNSDVSVAATIAYNAPFAGDTQLPNSPAAAKPAKSATAANATNAAYRTTVLPTVQVHDGQPTLLAEDQIRYETLKQLGQGGMGEVLKVTDNDIKRTVALKRLLPGLVEPAVLSRFVEEIRIIGQLEHPNIVPVHDVGIDADGQYYFVMKYVEGETLESIIDKLAKGDAAYHKLYPFERRVEIFTGILEAVHYAHERGIIHRDIKPANVMIGPFGEVVVMDWGIAKRIKGEPGPDLLKMGATPAATGTKRFHETMIGALIGTPAYMSPEQAAGYDLDERSDIYSLCVLLYEFLTLQHYLDGKETLEEVVRGVLTETPRGFALVHSPHQSTAPIDLHHFVRKGLEKDVTKRYQSVSEMIVRLRARREGFIPVQCAITFTKRIILALTRGVDRHPLVTLMVLCLLCLGSLGGLAYGAAHLVGAI